MLQKKYSSSSSSSLIHSHSAQLTGVKLWRSSSCQLMSTTVLLAYLTSITYLPEYLTATAIFSHIKKVAGSSISNTNIRSFGRWLMNLDGLQHKGSNQGTKYLVRKKM